MRKSFLPKRRLDGRKIAPPTLNMRSTGADVAGILNIILAKATQATNYGVSTKTL